MKIIEKTYKWSGSLMKRTATKYIVLHHRAGDGDVESIHQAHISNGWSGIGYHFYVRKNGSVYRGRTIETVGAHCTGLNNISLGICFEGNFENETMSAVQIEAGRTLISYLKALYPYAEIKKHKELNSTACPGRNFPVEKIKKGEITVTVNDAKEIIKDKAGLENDTINFLLCYKYGEELLVKLAKAMK